MFFKTTRLKNAYKIGKKAYKNGKHLSDNPYSGRFSKARRRKTKTLWDELRWAMIDEHEQEQHEGTLAGQWNLGWREAERSK